MKKIIWIIGFVFYNASIYAQSNNLLLAKFKTASENIYAQNAALKKLRSPNRQLNKIDQYRGANSAMPSIQSVLSSEYYYTYNSNFAANQNYNEWTLENYVTAVGNTKTKRIANIASSTYDSLINLLQYDNQNRLIAEVETKFNGINYDTTILYLYAYSGNNLNFDTGRLFDNTGSGLSLSIMIKNFLNNDLVDSNYLYTEVNNSLWLVLKQFNTYNTFKKLILRTDEYVSAGTGFDTKFECFYTSNSLDSTKRYEKYNNAYKLIKMNVYSHVSNGVNIAFFTSDSITQLPILDVYQKCILNNNNKVTQMSNFKINGNDTFFISNNYFEFDNNNDLKKTYARNFDSVNNKLANYAIDSTNYYYSNFIPDACYELNIINNFTVYPNPATFATHINYESNDTRNYELVIKDIQGKIAYFRSGQTNNGVGVLRIDTQHWASGIYRGAMVVDGIPQRYFKIQKQ
jgi:Secretion system C-terminal sorting domain